ncbi:MAG: cytochrome bc complex cytochrome b subunit [Halodesulfurarchaeum sp.]
MLGKAFPAEDSFLLGEVALVCFVLLVLTGIFLGSFYEPSIASVSYQGVVAQYQGETLPAAFASVLHLTYAVPFGMFVRRLHHWAAHLFIAAIALHMLRVFFTAAYRNPREPNWVVGSLLAILAIFASYTGYSLPFDEFASTATGIGYSVATSVPLIGDFAARLLFAGSYPSSGTIPRLFFLHVVVIPGAIAVLLGIHMLILLRQKHTEGPRSAARAERADVDREDDTVLVGLPAVPNQAFISAVVFFLTAGVLSLLAGFFSPHNIAAYGPNDPASTPSVVMPDWFLMWLFGFLKTVPSVLSVHVLGVELTTEFWGGVVLPGLVFTGVIIWPFLDRSETEEHFTADPLARPAQTAIGVGAVVLIITASLAGMNSQLATALGVPVDLLTTVLTFVEVGAPIVAGLLTYWLARGASTGPGGGVRD